MDKKVLIKLLFLAHLVFACNMPTQENRQAKEPVADTSNSELLVGEELVPSESEAQLTEGAEEEDRPKIFETRIRFQNYTLVIHNFKGYEREGDVGNKTYSGQFGGGSGLNEAYLNDAEENTEQYKETLVVWKDSIHLSESLGGNEESLNENIFQVEPNNPTDSFSISTAYLTQLYEMFERPQYTEEELEKLYKNHFIRNEKTAFIALKDSANYYFHLKLLKQESEQFGYINGRMSKSFYAADLNRIKKKYNLRDTFIADSSEGGSYYASLTKNNRIFGYNAESYIVRIERYNQEKLIDTKFVVIYIRYGC